MISNTSELELPRGLVGEPGVLGRAKHEVLRFLPAWMFFVYACLLLNTGLTNFDPPRPDFSANAVFPLAVFVGFYVLRALKAPEVENRWAMVLVTVGLAVCLPLLNLSYHQPSPLAGRSLLVAFELSNFIWAALLIWHAWRARRGHGWLFFGAGLAYGVCLENGGILLGFFHEENLALTMVKPLMAPVATMIGWCVVLYMSTFVVWQVRRWLPRLRRHHFLSGLMVATVATLVDLQIDPLATAAGAWVWHASLPPWFHGVPQVNFVAWMCALTPFAWAMFRAQDRLDIADGGVWTGGAVLQLGYAIPGALLIAAMMFISATGALEGLNGPSWTLLNQFTATLFAWVLG
jgi:uncharacterized membrane protein